MLQHEAILVYWNCLLGGSKSALRVSKVTSFFNLPYQNKAAAGAVILTIAFNVNPDVNQMETISFKRVSAQML